MMAGQLKVVCYGGIRTSIGKLALLVILDVEILIQVDINIDISVAINADTGEFHCVFIRNIGIFSAISFSFVSVVILMKHKQT